MISSDKLNSVIARFELTNTPNFGNAADKRAYASYNVNVNTNEFRVGQLQQNQEDAFEKLTQIVFKRDNGTFGLNSRFTVYGVKK